MYPTNEYVVLLLFGVTLSVFLFLAATLIFLLEEATKFFVHFLGETTRIAWKRLSHFGKTRKPQVRSASCSVKP
ncbi:MAG: hypothetical protein HY508_14725 [Acidobacteria bacterium]|nr:hypothetical protein [Acidobacteriota bacterium]